MRAHVADGTAAPIDPTSPIEGMVDRVIGNFRPDAEEKIPGESVRNRVVSSERRGKACIHALSIPFEAFRRNGKRLWPRNTLRPEAERAVSPNMDFADLADGAGLDVFDGETGFVGRVTLVAHLRGDLGFFGLLRELAGFSDGPGKRLLYIDVLAKLHCGERDRRVHVIGSGDDDSVDVLLLFEHLSIVFVALRLLPVFGVETLHIGKLLFRRGGIQTGTRLRLRLTAGGGLIDACLKTIDLAAQSLECFAREIPVHVAERDNVLAGQRDEVRAAHSSHANARDIQQIAGRSHAAAKDVAGNNRQRSAADCCVLYEFTPCDWILFRHSWPPSRRRTVSPKKRAAARKNFLRQGIHLGYPAEPKGISLRH